MSTSSADPEDLDAFVRKSRDADRVLNDHHARLVSLLAEFNERTEWGELKADELLSQFGVYNAYNKKDADWVKDIARNFREAGSGSGPRTLSDAAINASLRARGLDGGRKDITVDSPEAFGVPATSGYANDPVNTGSGNFVEVETDLNFEGLLLGLVWTRTYNSRSDRTGAFGPGWSSWTDARLVRRPFGAEYQGPDGQRVDVPRLGDGYGRSRSLRGLVEPDGDGLVLTWFGGGRWVFDPTGRVVLIDDGPGTTVRCRHEQGRLAELVHEAGKRVTLEWSDERVVGVRSSDGREVRYTYDNGGHLVAAERAGASRQYRIGDDGRIMRVLDPDGVVEADNVYDPQGRLREQVSPFGRHTRFTYLPGRVGVTDDGAGEESNTWVHDPDGRLIGVVDAHDNRLSKSYDTWGNPVLVTERNGATTVFEWDARSRLTRRVLPTGAWFSFGYDDVDRIVEVTSSTEAAVRYSYDGDERIPSEIVDAGGGVTRLSVSGGAVHRVVDPDGIELSFDVDTDGNLIGVTDGEGNTARLERDATGRILAAVSPTGLRTEFRYDDRGRAVERRDPGGAVWRFAYSAAGRLTEVVDPLGGRREVAYGEHGQPERVVDPLGRAGVHRYDAFGNVAGVSAADGAKWELRYDALSRLTSVSDPAGATWLREYDTNGNLVGTVDPVGTHFTAVVDEAGRVTALNDGVTSAAFTVDPLGRTLAHSRPDGTQLRAEYDLAGRRVAVFDPEGGVTRYEYTPGGRLRRVVLPSGRTEEYEYDRCGRLVVVVDGAGERWTSSYDADGRLTSRTAPDGSAERLRYDDTGRLASRSAPGRGRTDFEYDLAGRVTAATDRVAGRRRFSYDAAGQLVMTTDANGGVTRYSYDDRGRLTLVVDPLGGAVTRRYDEVGHLVQETDPLGRARKLSYDSAGRLVEREDGTGTRLRWQYDVSGRVRAYGPADDEQTTVERDVLGRPVTVVEPGSFTHRLVWDRSGRLVERHRDGVGVGWRYDEDGQRIGLSHADGSEVAYSHDAAGRLVALRHPAVGPLMLDRDANGRLVSARANGWRAAWRYDDGELTGYEVGSNGHRRVTEILRDDLGRVRGVRRDDGGLEDYAYDAAGQLVSVRGSNGPLVQLDYDANGRLVREDGGSGVMEYEYDAAGQLVGRRSEAGLTRFRYDAAGRRLEEDGPDRGRTYRWDGSGNLTEISAREGNVPPRTVRLAVDGLGELAEVDGVRLMWDTADAVGGLLAVGPMSVLGLGTPWVLLDADKPARWLEPDWRGTPRHEMTDIWGGDTCGVPLTEILGLGQLGELQVDGITWLRHRAYDPATRAFLTPDPLSPVPGTAWSGNPYHYAGNNPVGLADPLGLRPVTDEELREYREQQGRNVLKRGWDWTGQHIVDPVKEWANEHPYLVAGGLVVVGGLLMFTGVGGPAGVALMMTGGAALSAGVSVGMQHHSTGRIDWGEVGVSAVVGAVAGGLGYGLSASTALKALLPNRVAHAAFTGGVTESIVDPANRLLAGQEITLRGQAAAFTGGFVGGGFSRGLLHGRSNNELDAVLAEASGGVVGEVSRAGVEGSPLDDDKLLQKATSKGLGSAAAHGKYPALGKHSRTPPQNRAVAGAVGQSVKSGAAGGHDQLVDHP